MQPRTDTAGTLADVIDRILDKGLVINADVKVNVVGVELFEIKIRAALASFETAAMYGLEFPSGTQLPEWAGRVGGPSFSRNGAGKAPTPQQ
ncbi:MAG: gas vesicle protein [Chloroflexi bacterium]|nr:gas vesicle protein [Chloroflexota bacterium]